MTQGNLGSWKKQIGDQVNPGDVLVEIETDKAQMDFECQDEGFLAKIIVESNAQDISVNSPICVLAENKEDGERKRRDDRGDFKRRDDRGSGSRDRFRDSDRDNK